MDLNVKKLCRLCLRASDDVVNIWGTYHDSAIASTLEKHFWFQIDKNDGLTEWICQFCWTQTKTFHDFYIQVEQYQKKCFWGSMKGDCDEANEIDERNDLASDLVIVKVEEPDLTLQTIDSQIREVFEDPASDCSDNPNRIADDQSTDDEEDQYFVGKSEFGEDDGAVSKELSEKEKQDAQIRELFTMKCEICYEVRFDSLVEVKKHYRNVHKSKGYLVCCGEKFWPRSRILDHVRYHSNPDALLKIEEENAQIREIFTMKCDICSDVDFESLLEARKHYRKVHKIKGYLVCCGRKFGRHYLIMNHVQSHINPDAFRCDQCGKRFRCKDALNAHINNHVPLDSRAFKCSLCTSSFAQKGLLTLHVKTKHTSKTGEKFPCDKCDKHFRSNLLLTHHTRNVHINAMKMHVCEICARQFKAYHSLQNHLSNEHSTTPLPKVQCNICGAWLKNESSLREHKKFQHQENVALKCTICDKMVKNRRLGHHMRRAHGERCHQCLLCDKAFKTAKNLKEHTATHTGEYLYDCSYCDKKFNSSGNLCSHRKKAHPAEWTRDAVKRGAAESNSTFLHV